MNSIAFLQSLFQCPLCSEILGFDENDSTFVCVCGKRYFYDSKLGYVDFIGFPSHVPGSPTTAKTNAVRALSAEWDNHWKNVNNKDAKMASEEVGYLDELEPGIFDNAIVLDVGSGTGRYLPKYLSKEPAVIFLTDISLSIFDAAKQYRYLVSQYPKTKVFFLRCDLFKLPFRSKLETVKNSMEKSTNTTYSNLLYTCCGVLNLLEDQPLLLTEAQRVANYIFILYNSPKSSLGKFYYQLAPIRNLVGKLKLPKKLVNIFSFLLAGFGFPLVYFLLFSKLGNQSAKRLNFDSLRFLIEDWIFCNPKSFIYPDEFYLNKLSPNFKCVLEEKPISRIIFCKAHTSISN